VTPHRRQHPLPFRHGAAERNHHLDVGESEIAACPQQGGAFERKSLGVARIVVPGRTAKAEHRILFVRLELAAAKELCVTRWS